MAQSIIFIVLACCIVLLSAKSIFKTRRGQNVPNYLDIERVGEPMQRSSMDTRYAGLDDLETELTKLNFIERSANKAPIPYPFNVRSFESLNEDPDRALKRAYAETSYLLRDSDRAPIPYPFRSQNKIRTAINLEADPDRALKRLYVNDNQFLADFARKAIPLNGCEKICIPSGYLGERIYFK